MTLSWFGFVCGAAKTKSVHFACNSWGLDYNRGCEAGIFDGLDNG